MKEIEYPYLDDVIRRLQEFRKIYGNVLVYNAEGEAITDINYNYGAIDIK